MRRSLLVAVVSLGISFVPATLLAAGNPNSCGPDVKNVVVQFFFRTLDSTLSNIVSDGGGIYANTTGKGNKITLLFQNSNCSYDFTMNLFQSRRVINVSLPSGQTTAWFFNFDRIGSVPVLNGSDAHLEWCGTFVTGRNEAGGFDPIPSDTTKPLDNYGGCITDNFGTYARRRVGFALANDYSLAFQHSPFEAPFLQALTSGTDYIKVYHPNENEWILEPENFATSAYFQSTTPPPLSKPLMPFRMTITRVLP